MASFSRSCCRPSSTTSVLLFCHFINPKLLNNSLRTYATTQAKPLKHKPSVSKPHIQWKSKSTPAISSKPPIPLQSISQQPPPSAALNPPSTTHPPPLDLPSKDPETPPYKYYYRLGKAYATFYKTGLKAIWTNHKAVRALNPPSDLLAAVRSDRLTRANFQLIHRSRADIRKIPPFILLWLVCGEFTPLVVYYVSAIVPRTIWIPKQFEAARQKAEARRRAAREKTTTTETTRKLTVSLLDGVESMQAEPKQQFYTCVAQSYGLYPAWWDRLFGSLIPQWEVKRRLYDHAEYLDTDDFAIERDGGEGGLGREEVVRACEERAVDVLGREPEELRRDLTEYFQIKKDKGR
ncbi:hypothetical protein JMJ35_000483 [Cladonia borealis]|uniref:Letm1 RBD domain-containing protein n=1 Tax=Cladonia borealis TaxID=184061 RepID=A0AA39RBK2_9LECA|nr:hypothetical protein JMJ35_000483 [Cladonia borealis]